jgi:transposase
MRFLTKDQEQELRALHRKGRDRSVCDRIKAVLLSNDGWTYLMIAKALMVDDKTVSRYVSEYQEKGKLKPETGGSESKLTKEQTNELIQHLEATTYVKVQEICVHVELKYGATYTVSGMTSWLKAHGFAYKKPKGTPAKADPIKQEAWIKAYEELMKTTPEDEPILFGDGVHPTMATKVTYGWIKKGTNKPIATTASRTRMNLMGALNLETMGLTLESYDTIDGDTMVKYLGTIKKAYPDAPKIHLILDRGGYNISKKTRGAAEKHGIEVHFLPPYSPNLNPIERLWKVMNEYVRNNRVFTSAREFREGIMNFFQLTWPTIAMTMVDRINHNFQSLKPTT